MNITVVGSNGEINCRPDTTWEREDKDFFVPDEVNGFSFTPVMFVKMSRAGKCIGEKFAQRYYETVCFGMLLKAEDDPSGDFYDRSSILPAAMYSKHTLENPENEFNLMLNGQATFKEKIGEGACQRIDGALSIASKVVSQRIGDIVAIELAPGKHLISRTDSEGTVSGTWCENQLFEFRIIF